MKVAGQKLASRTASTLITMQNIILKSAKILLFRRNRVLVKEPRTILVFRSSGVGDFVCAMPALNRLNEHFKKSKIVLLTIPSANPRWQDKIIPAGMLLADHLLDEKLLIPGDKLKDWTTLKNVRSRIKCLNPDLCIILPFSGEGFVRRLKKMVYLRILGVSRNMYGIHLKASLSFFASSQFAAGEFKHQVEAAIEPLKEIGIKSQEIVFDVKIPRKDEEFIDRWWQKYHLACATTIAIHPGSNYTVKRWPIENFESLGKKILRLNPNFKIVLVGGKDDEALGEALVKAWGKNVVNCVGKLTLLQTPEALRRCRLFVGNDSGPMHLAAAAGTPVVAIFSSITFPVLWKPWGEHSKMIRHSVPCEFCFSEDGKCPQNTYECIRDISVEEVLKACLPYLESAKSI